MTDILELFEKSKQKNVPSKVLKGAFFKPLSLEKTYEMQKLPVEGLTEHEMTVLICLWTFENVIVDKDGKRLENTHTEEDLLKMPKFQLEDLQQECTLWAQGIDQEIMDALIEAQRAQEVKGALDKPTKKVTTKKKST